MSLHIVKLCVGAESLEDQLEWSKRRLLTMREQGVEPQLFHVTRMMPKRQDELLSGGSLYWVIKGQIQARQKLQDIVRFTDDDGISRCKFVLDHEIIHTQWQPKRAFQGWRYLKGEEAPADLPAGTVSLPAALRAELADLGLL